MFSTSTHAAVGLLALACVTLIASHLFSPLRSIPGPLTARFTRLWFFYRVWQGGFEKENTALHRKHGDVVRYAPGHYSFNSPEAVSAIYGKGKELDKSSWYEAWNAPGFKTLFTEPSIKVHGQLRRKFQSTYSMSSLLTYEAYADHCTALLISKLEAIAKSHGRADMALWLLCYAADTVAMISYSRRMGFLDQGADVDDFFKDLHGNLFYNTTMGIYAWIHPMIFNTTAFLARWGLIKGSPRMSLARFTTNVISKRRVERAGGEKGQTIPKEADDETAPKDFLSKFLDSNERDPSQFTERDIIVGLIGNVIAGADTTASALSAILYQLLKNPTVLSKLRDEIDTNARAGRLSVPPTFKEVQSMPYLQAIIQEAQRLHPAAGLPLQRVVPEGGADIAGYTFPAGTVVGVNPFVLHSNSRIFGDDATSFRPERWLDPDKEKVSYMQRHNMAFGLGSRTCIGRNISMLEMSKLVPELVRNFDFELDDELKGECAGWKWINYWLMRPVSLPVKIRMRVVQ